MKYANDNGPIIPSLKYAKLFFLKSILLVLIPACGVERFRDVGTEETVIVEEKKEEFKEAVYEIQPINHSLKKPQLGIDRLHLFKDSLVNKRIAVVSNQTSMVGDVHLVDTLLALNLDVKKVFAPEHGFRGDADAGEKFRSTIDEKTGLPLISLYGSNKKPLPSQLKDVDIVIYDIQDVGVRFYTYISTLHYVMEACAENGKQLVVLDRPNPNGHYVDGPILEPKYKSFVGMHPVPIVYGMTIGEYAMMVNGERWLDDSLTCKLWVIPCKNYTHKTKYNLPIPPSPNLRSETAITLYPSLCLFEATTVSVGRGTDQPFETYGHPKFPNTDFSYTPISTTGAKNPLYENKLCHGFDLKKAVNKRKYEINLNYLIHAKELLSDSVSFIDQNAFFNQLAGTDTLKEQLLSGWSSKEIRSTWEDGISQFKKIRQKYLLYE
jgi:uncharacterized protein YbbC (DUF1343 family)